MEKVAIFTDSKNYEVFIGEDILDSLHMRLNKYSKVLLVTDETVNRLHLNTIIDSIPERIDYEVYTTPSGEKAKTFKVYEDCISFALKVGIDRKSVILAFGGGAIGDLAGFVAATYMRGIAFIQIPTTILAHDSAVGGKVGINHPLGKNMVGAFYQPDIVIYNTNYLNTLPVRQIKSGFAEVVKHALIADVNFLNELMNHVQSIEEVISDKLPTYLKRGIEVKAKIVGLDERESGVRAYLNFGHTLGHALEAHAGFGNLTHGEGVMCGMVYALLLSKKLVGLDFDLDSFINWIERLGYQWKIPSSTQFDTIYELMKRDKKSVANKPVFVLLKSIGEPVLTAVDVPVLRETFYMMS